MGQPETIRDAYDSRKNKALDKVHATLKECLEQFYGEENDRICEDIANYMVGYLGVAYGLHISR